MPNVFAETLKTPCTDEMATTTMVTVFEWSFPGVEGEWAEVDLEAWVGLLGGAMDPHPGVQNTES